MSARLKATERKSRKTEEKKPTKRESSASRVKKPATRKSPARTPIKTKSPRKTPTRKSSKSPAHKSPVRKSPVRRSSSRQSSTRKSPSRHTPVSLFFENDNKGFVKLTSTPIIDIDTDSDDAYVAKVEKPLLSLRSRARRLTSDYKIKAGVNDDDDGVTDRNYVGIIHKNDNPPLSRELENVVHVKQTFTSYEHKLSEFSDEDDVTMLKKTIDSIPSHNTFVVEFGGWFGALFFIIFLPFAVIFLNIVCNKSKCSFSLPLVLEPYKNLSTYFDLLAGFGFTAYVILLAVLVALPFGGKKVQGFFNKNGKLSYVLNGLFSAVVMHLILFGLEFYKVPVFDFIYEKYFQLIVSSILFAIAFSVYLYARSFFVPISTLNPKGDTNSIIYNFFMGREINPRICEVVDVKMLLLHISHISVVIFSTVVLWRSLDLNFATENFDLRDLNYQPTLLVLLFLFYVYFLDALVFEETWLASFEVQHEGVGYLSCLGFIGTSLTCITIPKYVLDFKVNLPMWQLATSVVQFFIGYVLYRGSNSQKYAFRKNPYSPAVAHLETIPTSQGKKLIVSGFWGLVRHPNYLGDILMRLSFLNYVLLAPPALTCLTSMIFLIHRAQRDSFHCKQKYEAAWDRYCQRVRYILVPKVY